MEGCLTTINLLAKMTTYAAANKKENETEYKAEQGNHEQQRETCFAVDNVTNGDTRRDTELDGPEVERQVGNGDNPRTDALGEMLHKPP